MTITILIYQDPKIFRTGRRIRPQTRKSSQRDNWIRTILVHILPDATLRHAWNYSIQIWPVCVDQKDQRQSAQTLPSASRWLPWTRDTVIPPKLIEGITCIPVQIAHSHLINRNIIQRNHNHVILKQNHIHNATRKYIPIDYRHVSKRILPSSAH